MWGISYITISFGVFMEFEFIIRCILVITPSLVYSPFQKIETIIKLSFLKYPCLWSFSCEVIHEPFSGISSLPSPTRGVILQMPRLVELLAPHIALLSTDWREMTLHFPQRRLSLHPITRCLLRRQLLHSQLFKHFCFENDFVWTV